MAIDPTGSDTNFSPAKSGGADKAAAFDKAAGALKNAPEGNSAAGQRYALNDTPWQPGQQPEVRTDAPKPGTAPKPGGLPKPGTPPRPVFPTGLGVGGAVIIGGVTMHQIDQYRKDAAVQDALRTQGLNAEKPENVLAARAYVWAKNMAPMPGNYPQVPWSGPQNERVAQALMRNEQANPGMLGRAHYGDRVAKAQLDRVVEKAMAGDGPGDDPTIKPEANPKAPTEQQGYAFETRTQEEADIVASMLAQGKNPQLIQAALENHRVGKKALIDSIHQRELGLDPAKNKFSATEAAVGARLEAYLGKRLSRDKSGDADWVDASGRSYDAVGPAPVKYFNSDSFTNSITAHLRKQGLDHVVVDMTGMQAEQQTAIREFIDNLSTDQKQKIIKLGF